MNSRRGRWALGVMIALAAVSAVILNGGLRRHQGQADSLHMISGWPENPRRLAELMLNRFGPPEKIGWNALMWRDCAPWKRVSVYSKRPAAPLELSVDYLVPPHRLDAVSAFSPDVLADFWHGELTVRGESEELGILALNLADEIAREIRSPEEARDFFKKAAGLSARGKSSPYMERLLFKSF